jgi:hypothetical protein
MAITTRFSSFQISDNDLITSYNSGAVAFGTVASFGIGFLMVRDAEGCVNRGMGFAIAAIPFIGVQLAQHYRLRINLSAIYTGMIAGISVHHFTEQSALAYSVGSIVSGVVATAITPLAKTFSA